MKGSPYKLFVFVPEGKLFEEDIVLLNVKTQDGSRGLMRGAGPIISKICAQRLEYVNLRGEKEYIVCSDGLMKMDGDAVGIFLSNSSKFESSKSKR